MNKKGYNSTWHDKQGIAEDMISSMCACRPKHQHRGKKRYKHGIKHKTCRRGN